MCDQNEMYSPSLVNGLYPWEEGNFFNIVSKAVISDSPDVLGLIFQNFKFELNEELRSLPAIAVKHNSLKCLKILQEHGFNLNHANRKAFLLACTEANPETFKYFVDNRDIDIYKAFEDTESNVKSNALYLAVSWRLLKGYLDFEDQMVILSLIEHGIDIHFENDQLKKYLEYRNKIEIWNFIESCQKLYVAINEPKINEIFENSKSYKIKK